MSLVSGSRFGQVLLRFLGRSQQLRIDPRVRVSLLNVGGQDITQATATVNNGGTTCDFEHGNRLEFEVPSGSITADSRIFMQVEDVDPFKVDAVGSTGKLKLQPLLGPETPGQAKRFHLYQQKKSESHNPATAGRVIASVFSVEQDNITTIVVEVWRVCDLVDPNSDFKNYGDIFSLLIALFIVACYLGVGVLFYHGFADKWSVREALYFSVVTFTTVGYGDFNASELSAGEQVFTAFFALVGVVIVGACVGIIGAFFLEREEKGLMQKMMTESYLKEDAANERRQTIVDSLILVLRVLVFLFGGMVAFYYFEDAESWVDAFYFSMITVTTIGFGDLSFASKEGQWFGIFFIPAATAIVAATISKMVDAFVSHIEHKISIRKLNRALTPELLDEMDEDRSGEVDESEFIRRMLVEMGKVSSADVRAIKRKFRQLDTSGDGVLTMEDFKTLWELPNETDVTGRASSLALTKTMSKMARSTSITEDDLETRKAESPKETSKLAP